MAEPTTNSVHANPPPPSVGTLPWAAFVVWAAVVGAISLWGFCTDAARRDFGHFLRSAALWRRSGELYESIPRVNLNPPHATVLLFTPLSYLPQQSAVWLWAGLQVICLALALTIIARELALSPRRIEWLAPAIAASAMVSHSWIEGQVGGLMLVVGALAWRATRRRQDAGAALALALLLSLKPQCALLLLATRRGVGWVVVGLGAAALALGVWWLGAAVWLSWLQATMHSGLQLSPWNLSAAALIYRCGATGKGGRLLYLGVAIFALIAAGLAARRERDPDRLWVLWGMTSLLVSPVAWVYYASAFLGPLIAWGERRRWPVPARIFVGLWLVPLPLVWTLSREGGVWSGVLFGSIYTWGAVAMWAGLIVSPRAPEPSLDITVSTASTHTELKIST